MDPFRTPNERFDDLSGFPFEPDYREVDGLRLAHIDEGDGQPVVFFHGEPTWSYLWRKVIAPVREAGYRCIAPDHAGFGRSDKPTDLDWYSYDRHVELAATLLADLDLRDATVVVHDWGGPIGLRLAVEHPDRIARMVIMDTGLFTGEQRMSEAWNAFRDFVDRTEDLPISMLVRGAARAGWSTRSPPPTTRRSRCPRRRRARAAFPLMLPTSPEMPGAAAGKRVLEALRGDRRPKLHLWADSDPIIPFEVGERFAAAIGAEPPEKIEDASHFLQEDAGEGIGRADRALAGRATMSLLLYRLGHLCARRRLLVIAIWVVAVAGVVVACESARRADIRQPDASRHRLDRRRPTCSTTSCRSRPTGRCRSCSSRRADGSTDGANAKAVKATVKSLEGTPQVRDRGQPAVARGERTRSPRTGRSPTSR